MNIPFIRPDMIFTYWVLLWFFVYWVMPKPTIVPNPSFALLVGLAENLAFVVYLVYIGAAHIVQFLLVVLITKGVPLYLVFDRAQLFSRTPVFDTVLLFVAYTVYLMVLGTNPVEVYRQIIDAFHASLNSTKQQIRTPFYYIVDQTMRAFQN
jgi:hypothetical protein